MKLTLDNFIIVNNRYNADIPIEDKYLKGARAEIEKANALLDKIEGIDTEIEVYGGGNNE